MGPYVKRQTATAIDDGWEIKDGAGEVIAILDTENLADVLMDALVNGPAREPPRFPSGEPRGEDETA